MFPLALRKGHYLWEHEPKGCHTAFLFHRQLDRLQAGSTDSPSPLSGLASGKCSLSSATRLWGLLVQRTLVVECGGILSPLSAARWACLRRQDHGFVIPSQNLVGCWASGKHPILLKEAAQPLGMGGTLNGVGHSATIQVLNFFCRGVSRWPLRNLQTWGMCPFGFVPLLLRPTPFCPVFLGLFYDWLLSLLMWSMSLHNENQFLLTFLWC